MPVLQPRTFMLWKTKYIIGILVIHWFRFLTQYSSRWSCQLHHEQSLCQFFWPLCFDFNKIIVWRIWLLLLWCFVSFFITAPKLGDFQIISQSSPPNSIQNKGCLQSGWSSGCHHHWGQNWLENRIADISRISVMYLVFHCIKVLGWSTVIVLWISLRCYVVNSTYCASAAVASFFHYL